MFGINLILNKQTSQLAKFRQSLVCHLVQSIATASGPKSRTQCCRDSITDTPLLSSAGPRCDRLYRRQTAKSRNSDISGCLAKNDRDAGHVTPVPPDRMGRENERFPSTKQWRMHEPCRQCTYSGRFAARLRMLCEKSELSVPPKLTIEIAGRAT